MGSGDAPPSQGELHQLSVDQLERGRYQPRSDMRQDTLEQLAESVAAQGVVQPIVARPLGHDRYEIIAGERRWRAAQLAGLQEVPVLVRQVPDEAAIAIALIENIQRENLNPLEEATALQRLLDEFTMTHQQAAEAVGRSRAAVSNLLRLLDLSATVQDMVRERRLEMGHARALLALSSDLQAEAARTVSLHGLSVRETEDLVRKLQRGETHASPGKPALDPDIRRLQDDLSERLGARVQLRHSAGGKGRLVIHYGSLDELDGILEHVK
jgi:ParB family chromosome partitioning protein